MGSFAAEVRTRHVKGHDGTFVGSSDDEKEAGGVHADRRGPFVCDQESADGFAGHQSCLESVRLARCKSFQDPHPFGRNDTCVVGVVAAGSMNFAGTDGRKGVECFKQLHDLVKHCFLELLDVGMLEELFVGLWIMVVAADLEFCGGDGGEEQVAEIVMVVGMVKVGKFGSHALSDGFHERFDVGRA